MPAIMHPNMIPKMHSLQRPAKAKEQRRSLWAGLRTRTSTGTDTSLIFAKPRSLLALSLGAPEPLLKQRKIEGHQVASPAVGTGAECATRPAGPDREDGEGEISRLSITILFQPECGRGSGGHFVVGLYTPSHCRPRWTEGDVTMYSWQRVK